MGLIPSKHMNLLTSILNAICIKASNKCIFINLKAKYDLNYNRISRKWACCDTNYTSIVHLL